MNQYHLRTRILVMALCFYWGAPKAEAGSEHWVTTWGCGIQLTEPSNLPPMVLASNTLRQFVHTSLGGKQLRVRFSNAYGTNSVTINAVDVALAAEAAPAGGSRINQDTTKALTFHGSSSVSIPATGEVVSDPCDFVLPSLANLSVTIYFGAISASTITGHPGSRTTSFFQSGNAVSTESLPSAVKTAHWYILAGIDVLQAASSHTIVVLGDSITDGRGSTTDANNRWPDNLAGRLATNAPTAGIGVVNMGIGGNGLFGGLGPSAQARFDRDVLGQNSVRWLILFEGVNDIGAGARAEAIINAYSQFIDKAHAGNLRVYGATITPFGGNRYFSPEHEAVRQAVNTWIRTSGKFDAVFDFDAVVRDPQIPAKLLSTFDTGDGLHLNPAGYVAIADSIDLSSFQQ